MNPSDSSWWWTHAFDAVAGGLVTATAVLVTLWWERRRGTDTQLQAEMAHVEALLWEWNAAPSDEWERIAHRLLIALASAAAAATTSVRALIPDLSDASVVLAELLQAGDEPTSEALQAYQTRMLLLIVLWRRDQRAYKSAGNRAAFRPAPTNEGHESAES